MAGFYISQLLLLTVASSSLADNYCSGIFFNNDYYNVNILKEGVPNIHQIVYSENENTLYFTFDRIAKDPTRSLGYLKIDTEEAGLIDIVRNATGLAIDNFRNRIYVGGSDGLYFLNDKKVPERIPVQDSIEYLFFKDDLYFINARKEAFKFSYGTVQPVQELYGIPVDKLILDDDNNIFILQNNKLSRVKIGTRLLNTLEKYVVDAITTNVNFKPYVSTTTGVYMYNKYKYILDKVSDINNLQQLILNRNGEIIYVVKGHIVKLTRNPIPCLGN